MIPQSDWKWYGRPGHFICGQWCRFHMLTEIGNVVVSTVGLYVHPRHSGGSERTEVEWLIQNPNGEQIGYERFYETMVFGVSGHCEVVDCNCGQPMTGEELDMSVYQTCGEATKGHMAACEKWASK